MLSRPVRGYYLMLCHGGVDGTAQMLTVPHAVLLVHDAMQIADLVKTYKVDAYINGHDQTMTHADPAHAGECCLLGLAAVLHEHVPLLVLEDLLF